MKRIWLSKESGIFYSESGQTYWRGWLEGKRRELALSKEKLPLAQAIRTKDKKLADILGRKKHQARRLPRFEEIAKDFLAVKAPNWAGKTLESAELHVEKHLIPWFDEHHPYIDEVNEATWEEYITAQREKNPTRKLFNDCKHIRSVMKFAFQKGLTQRHMSFRDPDPERKAGRRLTKDQISALLLAAGPMTRIQILMAVTMGMRKSEILRLSWDRVDLVERTIHLRAEDTKIRKARTMGMSRGVYEELKRLSTVGGPYVFASRYDHHEAVQSNKTAWAATKRRSEVRCRFHDLRHEFISRALLDRQLNPLHVAVYAGVSLQEIQRTYLHPTVEDTRSVAFDVDWGKAGGIHGEA